MVQTDSFTFIIFITRVELDYIRLRASSALSRAVLSWELPKLGATVGSMAPSLIEPAAVQRGNTSRKNLGRSCFTAGQWTKPVLYIIDPECGVAKRIIGSCVLLMSFGNVGRCSLIAIVRCEI